MSIKCLFLDHDDTVVDSTRSIHYPAFVEVLKKLRPEDKTISYFDFVDHCHRYGFIDLCEQRYAFTKSEMEIEYKIWKSYTQSLIPSAYSGIKEILTLFKKSGGIIVVISHSESSEIARDYLKNFEFLPDAIYGWDRAENERKPHPFPILNALKIFNLKKEDCLMIDDMSLGKQMAQKAGVQFAWAEWSHQSNGIEKNTSDLSFESLDVFKSYLKI